MGYDKSDREDPNVDRRTTVAGRALPEGRYGSHGSSARGRRRYPILIGLVLLVGVGIAFVGYRTIGSAPIEAQRTGFEAVDGTSMRISFEVTRDDPQRRAVCVVRVRVLDGSEGGRREVIVAPGENPTAVTAVVRSSAEPVTADVFGCTYQVPAYMSRDLRPTG